MKQVLLTAIMAVAVLLPVPALAVDSATACSGAAAATAVCKDLKAGQGTADNKNPVIDLIKTAINILTAVAGIVAVVTIIISGIRFVTAQGDAQGVAAARSSLIYVAISLIIIALAQSIVIFVINNIG